MNPQIIVDPTFSKRIGEWAAVSGKTIGEAFRIQARLLANELIRRTPPFSGKAIMRMLSARGAKASLETEGDLQDMTARNVGRRRVEKDIRRTILGVKNTNPDSKDGVKISWGTLQKCEGKQAVRVFATKKGDVYGVDLAQFKPNAPRADLYAAHQKARTKRGRVSMAGQKTRDIGRWKWLDLLVSDESTVAKFIKRKQDNVGRAKAGWAKSFMALGGRMSKRGWVGKHADSTGECRQMIQPYNVNIEMVNKSEWAQGGDDQRVMAKSMAGRAIAIQKDIEYILKEKFK